MLIIIFLPRSRRLLISWLQSPSAVILEPPQNKVSHSFHCFPICLPRSDGTGCHDLSFLNAEEDEYRYIIVLFSCDFSIQFLEKCREYNCKKLLFEQSKVFMAMLNSPIY